MLYLIKCTRSKVPINIRLNGQTLIIPAKGSPPKAIEFEELTEDIKKLKENKIISLIKL